MLEALGQLEGEFRARIEQASAPEELELLRNLLFGRRGRLTGMLREVGSLPREERREAGQAGNRVREGLLRALEQRRASLRTQEFKLLREAESLDVTAPGRWQPPGRLHPLRELEREAALWLGCLGFSSARPSEGLPEAFRSLSGKRFWTRQVSVGGRPSWGGWGHHELLEAEPEDPSVGHLMEAASREPTGGAGHLRGLLEALAAFLGCASHRVVPAFHSWARPSAHLLGAYAGGWLGLASAGWTDPQACSSSGLVLGIALERACAVRHGLPPALFQSLDWRFLSQF